MELEDVYRLGPTKVALIDAFARHIDRAVLDAGIEDDAEESPRERLFEIMMRRYDALKPYREGISHLVGDLRTSPLEILVQGPTLMRAMETVLVAAGLDASGWRGMVRAKALAGVHLQILKVFLADESEDLGKTMAAVDRHLGTLENLAKRYKI